MKTLPRVAHLIATNFYGGPERQIVAHALRIGQEGFAPLVVSFTEAGRDNGLLVAAKAEGVPCAGLSPRSAFHPGAITEIADLLRREGVGLLVAHGYKANIVGRLASRFARIPQISVSRGWTAENSRIRVYEMLDRKFLRLADHVVAVSEGQARKVAAAGVPGERLSVIHNGIDLDSYPPPRKGPGTAREGLGIPKDALLVATAGRLSPEKDQASLVAAAARIAAERDDVWFAVFGEGFLRPELERAVREAGLEGRFLLPGFRSDMREVMHEVDVFTLPSLTEGLPNVVLEAFACRKPVVATAVGGTPEVVRHGENGLLVAAGDGQGLTRAIRALAASPEERRSMGERGYETVRALFNYESQTAAYGRLYRRIMRPDATPAGMAG
ncbi:glycosyltransferase [Desulfovibrio sp. X2]|uniref:glycosyltransferase n=1 Tax=Desulfovibrio sp. X2 TaxID=941449 RepID=UPI00126847D3|nr:glycosyltransferase [Desulfovibrio sp. X2]